MAESLTFLPKKASRPGPGQQHAALDLAGRLPPLVLAARTAAAAAESGVHGRRRAGTGESFWQFRPFVAGEAAQSVDWRRSARDDRLYVREREWEAAQVLWVWSDLSPSMNYRSPLALQSKAERGLVLALALAESCAKAGERVGWLGLTRLSSSRDSTDRLAVALLSEARRLDDEFPDLPAAVPLRPREKAVLIGDFLVDVAEFAARLAALAGQGARGHVLAIFDPVEEAFPFEGQAEFFDEAGALLRAGRAEQFAEDYRSRLASHRAALEQAARAQGWTFALHGTDRPATEALLSLRLALAADGAR